MLPVLTFASTFSILINPDLPSFRRPAGVRVEKGCGTSCQSGLTVSCREGVERFVDLVLAFASHLILLPFILLSHLLHYILFYL